MLLASALLAGAADSRPVVDIVQPMPGEILYGETVIAAVPGAVSIAQVLFYLDDFALPICRTDGAPYECRFDAGTRFAGRKIRVEAYDAAGKLVGSDTLHTTDATEAIRVTSYSLTVPVVATTRAGAAADLHPEDLTCLYGAEECEVLGLRKLVEERAPEQQAPVHVEMLIDTSGSMRALRKQLETAAAHIIEGTPRGTLIQIAEFAHVRRIVVPFTDDREALRAGMADLGKAGDMSCVFSAMESGARWLAAQGGARVLFVISDGVDTCDPGRIGDRFYPKNFMAKAFQELKVSLYLFRMAVPDFFRSTATFAIYENLALVTGGRFFDQGTFLFGGAGAATGSNIHIDWAAEQVVGDLNRTHILEVGLPDGTKEGTRRRLELVPGDPDIRLRYQEYWDAKSRKEELLRMLYADLPASREKAAAQLAHTADVHTAAELLAALQVEPVLKVRAQEQIALYNCLISGLLYGGEEDQKAAVKVSEQFAEDHPQAFGWLLPVTRVYLKTPAPAGLKKRVRALMGSDQP